MKEQSKERTRIERMFVKYKTKSFCVHDIMAMTNDEIEENAVRQIFSNLQSFFFCKSVTPDTCERQNYAHKRLMTTDKLIKKYSDFEEEQDEAEGEEQPKKERKKAGTIERQELMNMKEAKKFIEKSLWMFDKKARIFHVKKEAGKIIISIPALEEADKNG